MAAGPTYNDILDLIKKSVNRFNKGIPKAQRLMYEAVIEQVNRLDLTTDGRRIRTTVKNLSILTSIRNKITRVLMTDEYKAQVREFVKSFSELTTLQNQYWKAQEKSFKPRRLLKAIRVQAVNDTLESLTESGIHANVGDKVVNILKTSITSGGSYDDLADELREGLLNTEQKGYLDRYARQVTTDSLNQYSAQYMNIVSSDLGFEWYKYSGSDILTTRCFCDAMTDQPYFHVTEIPKLLKGQGLFCTDKKSKKKVKVKLNPKTNLPYGMIPGTDASNFQVRRGGYNCGHQVRPVSEDLVPADVVARVKATPAYRVWLKSRLGQNPAGKQ